VDPNGNDGTAVVGDFTLPWATVSGAIQYAMDNVEDGTVHIMSGQYNETVQIVPTLTGGFGINVISEPGVDIIVDLGGGGNSWITDDAPNLYPIKINWEGAFGFGKYRPNAAPPSTITITGDGDKLYVSRYNSYLRFKNVCIVKDDTDTATSEGIFHLTGDATYGYTTTLWLDGCRIVGQSIYSPIIKAQNASTMTSFSYNIDIKSCEIIWNGEFETTQGNRACFKFMEDRGVTLNMRNSYIFGTNEGIVGNDVPIYLGGRRNLISIDDVQFHAYANTAGVETIYAVTAGQQIWISTRCISWFDVPFNCTNPIFGVLDCNITFPQPII
jgi:hypothetical protein